ncbi:MAG: hypothetical protein ACRDLF_15490 [Solirubrobacteraceae bacterium]
MRELAPALGAAALASIAGILVLELWKAHLQSPFVLGGDSTFPLLVIKDIMTHGWDLTNPNLGAPFGQELYDYPATSGDSLYLVMLKVLGLPFSNPALVLNLFFLLGFPLIAGVACAVLRKLGISTGVAVVCATLYAVLPFRFGSGETHLFLSSYFLVPVCCYLVLAVLDGRELFTRDPRRRGLRAYLTWRSAAAVALFVAIGCSDNYFALFTVALMVPAALCVFLATRRRRVLVGGLVAASIVLGAVGLNAAPTIVYVFEHGRDTLAGRRLPQESEFWGFSLATLVLPIEGNRVPPLAHLAQRYNTTTVIPARGPASEPTWTNLGLVGTLGLLWLAVTLAIRCVGGAEADDPRGPRAALAAAMTFLIGTVGGLGTVFAYTVNPQLHAPDRVVVFLAFYALFGAALGLDRLRERLASRGAALAIALAAILLVGVLAQTSPRMVPAYTAVATRYEHEGAFIHSIEAQVPRGASIFQIPHVPFPEGSDPTGVAEYEDLFGSLHSNTLHWSGGAIEGRSTDWVPALLKKPLPQILEGVSATGFAGIYLETHAVAHAVLASLPGLVDARPLTSSDGRYAFFNMATYNELIRKADPPAQIAAIAASVLHPRQ